MHHDDSICAALPVEVRSVSLVYCHAHQGWTVYASHTIQADDEPGALKSRQTSFGPFDGYSEVARTARDFLEDLL